MYTSIAFLLAIFGCTAYVSSRKLEPRQYDTSTDLYLPGSVTLCSGADFDPGPYSEVGNYSDSAFPNSELLQWLGCVKVHAAVTSCVQMNLYRGFPVQSIRPDKGGYCVLHRRNKCDEDLDSEMTPITYPGLSHKTLLWATSLACRKCATPDCEKEKLSGHKYPQLNSSYPKLP